MIRVKVCGTTSVRDAVLAAEAGADAIGLIFAPRGERTGRRVTAELARQASLAVGPAVGRVGVYWGQPLDEVLRTAEAARLSAVQLHGEVPAAYLDSLLTYFPVLRVLKPGDPLPDARPGLTPMLDAPLPGGGVPLDWDALAAGFPGGTFPSGAWLAGGLGPDNVAQAIQRLNPAGVDAVSQLESAPGVKDPARVRAFVMAVRQASIM